MCIPLLANHFPAVFIDLSWKGTCINVRKPEITTTVTQPEIKVEDSGEPRANTAACSKGRVQALNVHSNGDCINQQDTIPFGDLLFCMFAK